MDRSPCGTAARDEQALSRPSGDLIASRQRLTFRQTVSTMEKADSITFRGKLRFGGVVRHAQFVAVSVSFHPFFQCCARRSGFRYHQSRGRRSRARLASA